MNTKVLRRMIVVSGLLAAICLAVLVLTQTTTSARVGEDAMTVQRLAGSDWVERHPSRYYEGSDWIERHPTVIHGPEYYLGSDWIERHPSNYYTGSDWIERHPGGGLP
jgi:hypothetical protein